MSVEKLLAQEFALMDYASRIEKFKEGRLAIYFHLSKLKSQNRRDHHIRIAVSTLEEHSSLFEGQVFRLANQDLITIVKHCTAEHVDEIISRMRILFANDSLADDDHHTDHIKQYYFYELINIETDFQKFSDLTQKTLKNEQERQKRLREIGLQSDNKEIKVNQPLTAAQMAKMEEMLSRADITNLTRRQAICSISNLKDPPRALFVELFISITTLAEILVPDVQIAANRWLFLHLTQILDMRMLKMMLRGEDNTLKGAVSLNFNVSTILSQSFLDYSNNLSYENRSSMVIELQFVDVISDFEGFIFARDFLKERGFRVCLDGVSTNHLPMIDRGFMGVDLVKVSANRFFGDGSNEEMLQHLSSNVKRIGEKRIVLTHCDNEDFIKTGKAMGINLFQGQYIDQLLTQQANLDTYKSTPLRGTQGMQMSANF